MATPEIAKKKRLLGQTPRFSVDFRKMAQSSDAISRFRSPGISFSFNNFVALLFLRRRKTQRVKQAAKMLRYFVELRKLASGTYLGPAKLWNSVVPEFRLQENCFFATPKTEKQTASWGRLPVPFVGFWKYPNLPTLGQRNIGVPQFPNSESVK